MAPAASRRAIKVPLVQDAQERASHAADDRPASPPSLALPFPLDDFVELKEHEPVTQSAQHTAAAVRHLLTAGTDPVRGPCVLLALPLPAPHGPCIAQDPNHAGCHSALQITSAAAMAAAASGGDLLAMAQVRPAAAHLPGRGSLTGVLAPAFSLDAPAAGQLCRCLMVTVDPPSV